MSKQNPTPAAPAQKAQGLATVLLRNQFYRENWRSTTIVIPILALALLASVATTIYTATRQPETRYFAVDAKGALIPMAPLNRPYVKQEDLLNWVSKAVVAAYTHDAQNYQSQLQSAAEYFTTEGFDEFIRSMQSSGTLDAIKRNVLISSAVLQGAPVIVAEGETAGVYLWKIRVPVLVSYRSSTKGDDKKRMVTLVVARRSTYENPYGLGISQFVAADN